MKISFICTVLNEGKTIDKFLASLLSQTRLPDEIVICDGGSDDQTVAKIENLIRQIGGEKLKVKFKILEKKNLNRSQGRNEAIKVADGEIITVSDGGCILDKKWLEEIVKPFEKDKAIDVIGGFYFPTGDSILQKILGVLTSVPIEKVNPDTFLPSSRSIAFKKRIWELVCRYPENNRYNEDLVFAQRLKNLRAHFSFNQKAIVFWPQRQTISAALKQFFDYAVGDGIAGQDSPHFTKLMFRTFFIVILILLMFLSKAAALIGCLSLLVYLGYKAAGLTMKLKNLVAFPVALALLPLLNFVVMFGFIYGVTKRIGKK